MDFRKCIFVPLAAALMGSAALSPSFAQTSGNQAAAPTPIAASAATAVPALVPYSGLAAGLDGKPLAGETAVSFLLYKNQTGGEPLFAETQTVAVDASGNYKVLLGATSPNGLPADLFSTGEARWLEVQIAGQAPQPRVLLVSVPYALKAADAATLGGLPASAFALAGAKTPVVAAAVGSANVSPDVTSNVTTTGGSSGYLPVFTGSTTVADSIVFQNALGIGIGDVPNAALDVNGKVIVRGPFQMARIGNATTSSGVDSNPFTFYAQTYDTSTGGNIGPDFSIQAEPTGNDTSSPGATLNFLYSNGLTTSAETGLYINPNGTLNFAPGQTFPGADITGTVNASGYDLGGTLFATGSTATDSAYLGFAGNTSATGIYNAGVGYQALASDTTGSGNTGFGGYAGKTINQSAGTGSNNTALGYSSAFNIGSLSNATAIGAYSEVDDSNALVLGCVAGKNSCPASVSVGIGTTAPAYGLEVYNPTATNAELAMVSNGTDAAISVNNTASGGREYWIDSGSQGAGIGKGNFAIYDKTANAVRVVVNPLGQVGIGANPTNARLQVDTASGTPDQAIYAQYGTISDEGANYAGSLAAIFADGGGASSPGGSQYALVGTTDGSTAASLLNNTSYDDATDGAATLAIYNSGPGDLLNAESGTPGGPNCYLDDGADLDCTGSLTGSAKHFKIDDPLDPANKYLVHASVESSEQMNIYTGNVVTDELGLATVKLPGWFEAENGDFRYQLTVIGGRFAQAIVSKEIANSQFTISTNASNVKVSWQITAVRQDAYAKAHPLVAEQEKPANERGFYRHPELYGQPEEKQTQWGRHPQQMKRMNAMREGQKLAAQQHTGPILSHDRPASAVNEQSSVPSAPALNHPLPHPSTSAAPGTKPVAEVKQP